MLEPDEVVEFVLAYSAGLVALQLHGLHRRDDDTRAIVHAEVRAGAVERIVRACTRLETLIVRAKTRAEQAATLLAALAAPRLPPLTGCVRLLFSTTDAQLPALLTGPLPPSLLEIGFRQSALGFYSLRPEFACAVVTALVRIRSLETVNLSSQGFRGHEITQSLVTLIGRPGPRLSLDLRGNKFSTVHHDQLTTAARGRNVQLALDRQ